MSAPSELLVCPACEGTLDGGADSGWTCLNCDAHYGSADGVALLRLTLDSRSETVRRFYDAAPFPGYPPRERLDALRARVADNDFVRRLDAEIPPDARIAEIGCGTGQMSLYLARGALRVVAADLSQRALALGAAAARRFGIDSVQFVACDLHRSGLRASAFDLVYCSGVLHHTPDPAAAFAPVARLLRPGGIIVLGLYNRYARIPLRLRRALARLSGYRWIPGDAVLRARRDEPARREAWLRDQYRHPQEHRHSLGEVRRWFARAGIDYLRCYPSTVLEPDTGPLFAAAADDWPLEQWLAQLAWMRTLGREGGLFISIGRRAARAGNGG